MSERSAIEIVNEVADIANKLCQRVSFKDAVEIGNSLAKELADTGIYAKIAADPYGSAAFSAADYAARRDPHKVVIKAHESIKGSIPDHIGRILQLWQGDILGVKNRPGPLASMLVTAPAGAALGLGVGYLGNKLTGGHMFNNSAVNALAGWLVGAIPGLSLAAANAIANNSILDKDKQVPVFTRSILDTPAPAEFAKNSYYAESMFGNYIPVEGMKDLIYKDPNVAGRLSPLTQAAAVGLIEGAQNLPGRKTDLPIVTPSDIGRMAIGLGSGYASGVIAGKILGGIFGLSDQARQTLTRSGAAAGLIKAVIPIAFGG